MNKVKRLLKYFLNAIILCLCLAFIIKFAGGRILKQYVIYGIGSCKEIPLLCLQPENKIFKPEVNPQYLDTLVPQSFPKMSLAVPKGFNLVQELIKRRYYKKRHQHHRATIYLLYQEPKAFIKLYPDVKKLGIRDNYAFIRRLNLATLNQLNNLTDAFFVIMKSIFTPDIGNQNNAKMISFELNDLRGFISYTMSQPDNYFDCNIIDAQDNFFKIYIKDIGGRLDLNNVFAVISTLKPSKN